MKINNVQQNYLPQHKQQRQVGVSPQFTGAEKLSKSIIELLPDKKALEVMKKAEWLKGEIGGILITAVGTGTVAPIFIGTNPFVKAPKGASEEEKQEVRNTKWYTAMRQPISAALAILFQVSALKPIDKFLDKKFNIAENSQYVNLHMDQSRINNKSFIKTLAKKELKEQGIKKPSLFKILTDGWSKTMEGRKAYKDKFNSRVSEIGSSQLNELAEEFRQTGEIRVNNRTLDNPTLAELVNKNIDDYISDAKKLQIDNKGLAYYSDRAKTLVENEDYLREIFKDVPKDDAGVETFVRNLLAKEQNPKIQKLLKEILERPSDIRGSRIARTLARIDKIKELCGGTYTFDRYLEAMSRRNAELDKVITRLNLNKITDVESATKVMVNNTINKIADICNFKNKRLLGSIVQNTSSFALEREELIPKIYKDVTKSYKKMVEKTYKAFNQASKVAIGVCITLPITCTALNWVYPRLMEIAFPKLAGVKKDGGDK